MRFSFARACLACALYGLCGLGASAAVAQQAPKPAAQSAAQSAEVTSLAGLPAEIRTLLGEMSDRGGPFAPGCVSPHGEPHSRFSTARLGPESAQVTVERGGIAHFYDTREFRKIDGHWVALPAPPARN